MINNIVTWVEIPAVDFERAKRFYEAVFEATIEVTEVPIQGMSAENGKLVMGKMGMLPGSDPAQSGCGAAIFAGIGYTPSDKDGPLVYLNVRHDLDGHMKRVKAAGGRVILGRTSLGDVGDMAIIHDSEGNRIALHEQPR